MNKKKQIIAALTLALTMSACTPATTIIIEKHSDGSTTVEAVKTPSRMKKETKKAIGIVIAGAAMKVVDKNIFPYVQLVADYMISKKKIEKGIVDSNI